MNFNAERTALKLILRFGFLSTVICILIELDSCRHISLGRSARVIMQHASFCAFVNVIMNISLIRHKVERYRFVQTKSELTLSPCMSCMEHELGHTHHVSARDSAVLNETRPHSAENPLINELQPNETSPTSVYGQKQSNIQLVCLVFTFTLCFIMFFSVYFHLFRLFTYTSECRLRTNHTQQNLRHCYSPPLAQNKCKFITMLYIPHELG